MKFCVIVVLVIGIACSPASAAREVLEVEIDAPLDDIWAAFTTTEGLKSWVAPLAEIDFRVGGKWRTNYNPNGRLGDSSTIENTILSYDPKRMIALKATGFPDGFEFEEAARDTWSVFYFTPLTATSTRVTVVGLGYNDTEESRKMRSFFESANRYSMDQLKAAVLPLQAGTGSNHDTNTAVAVPDEVLSGQRARLAIHTEGRGFGPQSPRDIDEVAGRNPRIFSAAPPPEKMNLCNIHFHRNAEHKGGEFTTYAGNGDGHGYRSGYRFSGQLSASELASSGNDICPGDHGALRAGDTIEVHYVHSTARVEPGPTLGSCLNDAIRNPQLRVEAQVYVLVSDGKALDFRDLTRVGKRNDRYQALHIPNDTGTPVEYAGSTTGPAYNEKGSPFLVTWSVRPGVARVDIASVGKWCRDNVFEEDHAHGVRNLVINPDLLSEIVH